MDGAPIHVAAIAQTNAMAMAPTVPRTILSHLGIVLPPRPAAVAAASKAQTSVTWEVTKKTARLRSLRAQTSKLKSG